MRATTSYRAEEFRKPKTRAIWSAAFGHVPKEPRGLPVGATTERDEAKQRSNRSRPFWLLGSNTRETWAQRTWTWNLSIAAPPLAIVTIYRTETSESRSSETPAPLRSDSRSTWRGPRSDSPRSFTPALRPTADRGSLSCWVSSGRVNRLSRGREIEQDEGPPR